MINLNVKDQEVVKGILSKSWHSNLIIIYLWFLKFYGDNVVLTCGYEDRDYPSTHSVDPLRAFDIRSTVFDKPQEIADDINSIWIYDPDRLVKKVAIFHDVGRGQHIHIQVHENTIKKVLI